MLASHSPRKCFCRSFRMFSVFCFTPAIQNQRQGRASTGRKDHALRSSPANLRADHESSRVECCWPITACEGSRALVPGWWVEVSEAREVAGPSAAAAPACRSPTPGQVTGKRTQFDQKRQVSEAPLGETGKLL